MTCYNPKKLWLRDRQPINYQKLPEYIQHNLNKAKFKYYPHCYCIEVPCGECIGCRLDHANEWAGRVALEAKQWKSNMFLTLTYDNEHLPKTSDGRRTLKKKDLINFMKRLRKAFPGNEQWVNPITSKTEKVLRFFSCGEYGEKRGRPHYHAIIFNLKINDLEFAGQNKHGDNLYKSKTIEKLWGNGIVIIGIANYETGGYVARYCQKKAGIKKQTKTMVWKWYDEKRRKIIGESEAKSQNYKNCKMVKRPIKIDEKEKEFINMSRGVGIGRAEWEKIKDNFKSCKINSITIMTKKGSKQISICKYFKKLWEKEDWYTLEQYKYKQKLEAEERKKQLLEEYGLPGTEEEQWTNILAIKHEQAKMKAKLLKRL